MESAQIDEILSETEGEARSSGSRVALVTPYDGGNLGDAAIQDSMIANLRSRIPNVRFLGITLSNENFLKQHGESAFPLLASLPPFSSSSAENSAQAQAGPERREAGISYPQRSVPGGLIRRVLHSVPGLVPLLKKIRARVVVIAREAAHCREGYRVLRTQDLVLISGGGQLDEEYGGAWMLPFTVCKWVLLARLARVPCAMASVGACSINLPASRRFISVALRMCHYRSFREAKSRTIAARLFHRARHDAVVPDLALSMPESELPQPLGNIRKIARGRTVVALSPIAYGKPVNWPTPDKEVYDIYVKKMAEVFRNLLTRDYFVVLACSSLEDELVIPDMLEQLNGELRNSLPKCVYFASVRRWREYVAVVRDADYLIASRLHGTVLGFLARTPAIAISFDPKVDWLMEDFHQTDFLLHIRDFKPEDVLGALDRLVRVRDASINQIEAYRLDAQINSTSARQYDFLAGLALEHQKSRK